jgi:two-component system, NtrC family, sensor histidine kinase HydH
MSSPFNPDQLSQTLLRHSASSISITSKLDQMLQSISDAFHSDRCLLLRPETIQGEGFLSRLLSGRKPLWVDDGFSFGGDGVLPEEKDLIRPSFVCLPLCDETSSHGILYLGFSEKRTFSPAEIDLLALAAQLLGELIRSDHFHVKADEAISEVGALHELGEVVTSTLKLNDLLELILRTGSKILKARGGVLRLEDRRTGELKIRSSLGGYDKSPVDEKLSKQVLFTRIPLVLDHFDEEHPSPSVLSAPLISNRKSIGTLTFYDKEATPSKFDERDFQLLVSTANQISSSIENALIHFETSQKAQEQEMRARQLATLWELNKALLTTMDFDRILHTALTIITHGEGLRFNRAMLFLVNEKKQGLEGTMAVGPDSPEEAGKIWNALSQETGIPLDLIAQLSASPPGTSILNSIVKGIQIPLEQKGCFLTRTVLEGKAFNIHYPSCGEPCLLSSESGCAVGERLGRNSQAYGFATVPVMGKGKVIGVIVVDNIYSRQPIAEEDIQFLSMFANHAGLAIENATLYRHLEEVHQELKEAQDLLVHREKMVALGEMSSTIAHEIRNPLVSIGGFARRLYRSIPGEAPEKRYTQTIIIEVARLEKFLNDIMQYTNGESVAFRECDLRDIIEESLSMISEGFINGVQLIREYADDLPKVTGDYQQLKQTFFNLITNAHQAIKGEGMIAIRAYPFSKNGSSSIRVEVEDNGSGIDPKHLHHIFNPFYYTKESGLGLGLATVHKVVTSHRGQIEVDNQPGKGVKFIVTLPVG